MHKLLERQLLRQFGSLDAVPQGLKAFLEAVDASYADQDEGRRMAERSLELTSQELNELNAGLVAEVESRRRNEDILRAILESALDCVILMDGTGTVREFNPAACRTFGYTRDEAIGRPLADLIVPPDLRDRHHKGLAHYMATGEGPVLNQRIEISGMRKDGSLIPVELAIIPFMQAGKRMFAGYLRDLSDRVKAQFELARRQATVQLLQQVPLLAIEAPTVEEAAQVCLDRFCATTGWPVGHAYFWEARPDSPLGVLVPGKAWHMDHPDRRAAFHRMSEATTFAWGKGLPGRVWKSGKPAWIPDLAKDDNFPRAPAAAACGLRSGFAVPIQVRGKLLAVLEFFDAEPRAQDDELLRTLASIGAQLGNVLERKRSETQLKEAFERLQQVNRERNQFLNNAAHELGTPLTPIKLQVQLMKARLDAEADAAAGAGTGPGAQAPSEDKGSAGADGGVAAPSVAFAPKGAALERGAGVERMRKAVDILERNVDRLGHLVKDLLDAARLQTGQIRLQAEPTGLGDVLRTACDAYRQMAEAAGIRLDLGQVPPMRVMADPARLGQVFDNLLSNAIKFTPAGGRITVQAQVHGGQAVVEVRDTGIGMTPEGIGKLFQPFSQVHDTMEQSHPGTGLGLYICKGILEAGGGRLSCSSAGRGKGAVFTVQIPLMSFLA